MRSCCCRWKQLQERFETFHAENPMVFDKLVELAFEWKTSGKTRLGVKFLMENVRWRLSITTTGDEFKVNNSYTSRYARMLLDKYPEFIGMIETRHLKA